MEAAIILIKSRKQGDSILLTHPDGNPESIGRDLKDYLMGTRIWDVYEIANDFLKGGVFADNCYELVKCQSGDEDYAYLIDCDAEVLTCYKLEGDKFAWKWENIIEITD